MVFSISVRVARREVPRFRPNAKVPETKIPDRRHQSSLGSMVTAAIDVAEIEVPNLVSDRGSLPLGGHLLNTSGSEYR